MRDFAFCQLQTICWKCQHAVPDPKKNLGCPWFVDGEPVPGWWAIPGEIQVDKKILKTYKVIDCPMFFKDE